MRRLLALVFSITLAGPLGAVDVRNLSRQEYLNTFQGPNLAQVPETYDSRFVWPYIEKVSPADYGGFKICWGYVPFVYRTADGAFDHVYVSTRTQNVFVIVLRDNINDVVYGHHLLDLNVEYGMPEPRQITRRCEKQ